MNKKLLIPIVFIIILASCSTKEQPLITSGMQPTLPPPLSIPDYFPLKNKAYWVYEGDVRWTIINSSDVAEKKIEWKMEVKRVYKRNDIFGYEMLGAPWDLAWYEDGKEPSEYGIIQAGGNFYRTSNETVRRLMDENDFLDNLVEEYDIFLDVPLIAGKKFCDTPSLTRPDDMYCWVVDDPVQKNAPNIKGLASSDTLFEFPIYNGTNPDQSIIFFIPGVGISGYEYHHHGTVSDVEVRLSEYYPGE